MAEAPFVERPVTNEPERLKLQAILDELNPGPTSTKERLTDLNSAPGRGDRKNPAPKAKAKAEKEPQ